jgi:purine-binding chemotaxis protein CheW
MNDDIDINDISQYLTFTLGDEHFAIGISKVREVLDYTTITRVPRMPEHLLGVINLRGNVVPVIDLRLKLDMSAIEKTVDTCIMIVDVEMAGKSVNVGMLADSVQEVIDIEPNQIKPPPQLGTRLNTDFIKGMGKRSDEGFLIILDIDRVLSDDDAVVISDTAEKGRLAA